MKNKESVKILIAYSNPADTSRIRLDVEHKAIEGVINKYKLPPYVFSRHHATSIEDIVNILNRESFNIIHFSGHGNQDGMIFEQGHLSKSVTLNPKELATIISRTQPGLEALMLMSCFSADSIPYLNSLARYLITVFGPGNDESSIEFVRLFYENYFEKFDIENSFFVSSFLTRSKLNSILSPKVDEIGSNRKLIQLYPYVSDKLGSHIIVDLSQVEDDINHLDISRESFFALLTRKIRLHKWIFDIPRDRVILPIGRYFGVFSWKTSSGIVYCHRILQLNKEVNEDECETWAILIVVYNELTSAPYRNSATPSDPTNKTVLNRSIKRMKLLLETQFDKEEKATIFRKHVPEEFKIARSFLKPYLQEAEYKFSDDDLAGTVVNLEKCLSLIHELVDAMTSVFSQK